MNHRSAPLRPVALLIAVLGAFVPRPAAAAAPQPVANWGASGVPSYISMYIYVPAKLATNPPILVVSHYCGGSASAVFGQAGGIVTAADTYGFIMVLPQTTNPATSAKCWDVGSKQSLTHDGGGDTQAVAQMVKYTVTTYKANANRVYATGDSSGAMMTQALLAVYPDVFKAGASFAGVPAGCWSAGWSAASNWGGTCAGGNDIMTAQQWGDLARGMYPGYTGHRPRVQLFHGDADPTIKFPNFGEAIKEWTNVLGLATSPTSTTMGLTLGSHQATRQQWKNSCGYVVLDTFQSIGGDHGPSDALFNANYVIPFLGLDKTGDVDPEIAACSGDGGGGSSSTGGTTATTGTGTTSSGGRSTSGTTTGTGGTSTTGTRGGTTSGAGSVGGTGADAGRGASGGATGSGSSGGGSNTGSVGGTGSDGTTGSAATSGSVATTGAGSTAAGGSTANGGTQGGLGTTNGSGGAATGATGATGEGSSASSGDTNSGGASSGTNAGGTSKEAPVADALGCACALGRTESTNRTPVSIAFALGIALMALARRRSRLAAQGLRP